MQNTFLLQPARITLAVSIDHSNELFHLAVELVNQGNQHIFLTGKAGTGKTTFLKYIREHTLKQMAVVAPTGVAAINAGGSTIHSFFQLPFAPFLPEARGNMHHTDATNKHSLLGKIKLNRERIKVLQQLELLVIDEISMVRCDILDAIDVVLRHFRNKHHQAFGGVQLLAIGDMFQLPPVTGDEEWRLLSQFYQSPYFFDSRVMQQSPPVYVEFEKIYRQQDDRFIQLLNQVRNNALSTHGRDMLDALYQPGFNTHQAEGYIILTTHNHKADAINADALGRLQSPSFFYHAAIEGDFAEKAYPADEQLQLKEGAQVMFIKNDKEPVKRYFNGKIGVVSRLTADSIYVRCNDEASEIEVAKETWENIQYSVNKKTNQLEEEVMGSFQQYPLRLAWAITIHKSQGLTFEKAVIDAGAAFAAGQVYVALSRCTTLEGMVLLSRITPASLKTDDTIVRFSQSMASADTLKQILQQARKQYQQQTLHALFEFISVMKYASDLEKIIAAHHKNFNEGSMAWADVLRNKLSAICDVGDKFKTHLDRFFLADIPPEANETLQQRFKDAVAYFMKAMDELVAYIRSTTIVTDSKMQAKTCNELLKDIFVFITERQHLFSNMVNGFAIDAYYSAKRSFQVPLFTVNTYATASSEEKSVTHPELHYQLRQLRNKICEQKNMPIYMVASTASIDEMVQYLPQTMEDLLHITGFGKAKAEQYGEQFLQRINEYCEAHQLTTTIHEKLPKGERKPKSTTSKPDTKALSFALYQQGKNAAMIAEERNLALSTIEGHLAHYVGMGAIPVTDLVPADKLAVIEPVLQNRKEGEGLTVLMEQLNHTITYSELRYAMAAREWKASQVV